MESKVEPMNKNLKMNPNQAALVIQKAWKKYSTLQMVKRYEEYFKKNERKKQSTKRSQSSKNKHSVKEK